MTEAIWGDASKSPAIDWSMSASLENVVRSEQDIAEVSNLEAVVREWLKLDPAHKAAATLSVERPIILDGASHDSLSADGIAMLAERLPA
ncbi:hypothetical protein LQ953_01800 [Sphingomonas sp. IC-56]|uniref:hypothetical protein n=1 Tax=Sphingomonas sp. IC-56 TaxID=2898529 RepID=UPI001E39D517|nr:hypothetical protein [Sphingomonas sp. IC-56]MCD2322746.1 hypothetical protein [Sphingomonas sp. IC-56]